MQFTHSNSGTFQRLTYADVAKWKKVGQTNSPPFGPSPAVMFEGPDGERAWFHVRADTPITPMTPAVTPTVERRPSAAQRLSAIQMADQMGVASRDCGLPILTRHLGRGGSVDAMNQAWAALEGIDLGVERKPDEIIAVLAGDAA